jgi:hypothetical protein
MDSSITARTRISFFLFFITLTVSFRKGTNFGKSRVVKVFSVVTPDLMAAPPSEDLRRVSQMLSFVEPTTGVIVKLVGAMHYNPTSVALAYSTCNDLAEVSRLGSVVVESCPQRWNKTLSSQPEGSVLRRVFDNEMQAAAEVAMRYGLPIILGDQDIAITNKRMGQTFKQSIVDLLTPWKGGWKSLYDDIKAASSETLPSGSAFLGPSDFLNVRLLATTPISLFRYPLSFIVKAPVFGVPVVLALIFSFLNDYSGDASLLEATTLDRIQEILTSALIFGLETSVFARVFLISLLSERNDILAANILAECQRIKRQDESGKSSQKVVVAILGMAHCNGILNILSPSSAES